MKTRKELYKIIKDNKLETNIYNKFGCNYTNLSNNILSSYIDFYIESITRVENKTNKNTKNIKFTSKNIKNEDITVTVNSKNIEGVISKLIETLIKKRIFVDSEIKYIIG